MALGVDYRHTCIPATDRQTRRPWRLSQTLKPRGGARKEKALTAATAVAAPSLHNGSSFLQRPERSGAQKRNMPVISFGYGWKIGACSAKPHNGNKDDAPGSVSVRRELTEPFGSDVAHHTGRRHELSPAELRQRIESCFHDTGVS
jgi:hypothetical protein